LREAAENERIFIGVKGIRKLTNKWFETKTLIDLPKSNVLAKISITDLKRIDRAVYRNRSLASRKLNLSNIEMSHRSIRRYLNALGWKKIRS
jgi:hypothetical protein